jgi:hypothetical protein
MAEITSGRATLQQGLVATCKDFVLIADGEGAKRREVWHMSP